MVSLDTVPAHAFFRFSRTGNVKVNPSWAIELRLAQANGISLPGGSLCSLREIAGESQTFVSQCKMHF